MMLSFAFLIEVLCVWFAGVPSTIANSLYLKKYAEIVPEGRVVNVHEKVYTQLVLT